MNVPKIKFINTYYHSCYFTLHTFSKSHTIQTYVPLLPYYKKKTLVSVLCTYVESLSLQKNYLKKRNQLLWSYSFLVEFSPKLPISGSREKRINLGRFKQKNHYNTLCPYILPGPHFNKLRS